jgi:hypothetical protein
VTDQPGGCSPRVFLGVVLFCGLTWAALLALGYAFLGDQWLHP